MPMTLANAHHEGFRRAGVHTERFVAYVRDLTPAEAELAVPGLEWTVAETVAHVRSVYERYTVDRRRAASTEEVATLNAEDVARVGTDLAAAADAIEQQWAFLGAVVGEIDPETLFPFHAGQELTMAGGWGNLLGELLAHGDDLARATGKPFGIPGEDLEVMWRFAAPILTGWLRPGTDALSESWLLHLPFADVGLTFDQGALSFTFDTPGPELDHVLEVKDLEEFSLQIPYRRRVTTNPLIALLGSRFRDL